MHNYSPYTILWKPPFCMLPCSKTPTYKYDIVIILHSVSRKKCHKNFENRFMNKNFTPKNDLNPLVPGVSYMLHVDFFGAVIRILTCNSSLTAR